MKKSFVYISPDKDGKVQKSEMIDLGAFRNQNRMQQLSQMMQVPIEVSTTILAGKKFDNFELDFLKKLFETELSEIVHPIEEYPVSLESFNKIAEAVSSGKKIGIYGDYDGDGVTSAIIVYETLKQFTNKENLIIDFSRVGEEGFGFSSRGAQNMIDNNCALIFVLDTGSNSEDTLKMASDAGIEVIVIDHHPLGEDANIVDGVLYVNPHLHTELTPNPEELRNAGLSWFYCRSLLKFANKNLDNHYYYSLAVSALGTIADAGSQFEGIYNRGILHEGLKFEKLQTIEIFPALFGVNPQEINNDINNPDIARGFRILSLAKRMKTIIPDIVFKLVSKDCSLDEKMEILKELEEKYETFLEIADKATAAMLEKIDDKDKIIIEVAPPDIVPSDYIGMSGTLASRIISRLKKPAIIFVKDSDDTLKGSWRTGDLDGAELLKYVKAVNPNIIEQFGGHAPAGGLLLSSNKKFLPFKFILQEKMNKVKINENKQFFDNPNVIKYFTTLSMHCKEFQLEKFSDLSKLTPFNRYDVKMPSCFLTDVFINDIAEEDGQTFILFTDTNGQNIKVQIQPNIKAPDKGSTVDLLLNLSILSSKDIVLKSEFIVPSQFRMEG